MSDIPEVHQSEIIQNNENLEQLINIWLNDESNQPNEQEEVQNQNQQIATDEEQIEPPQQQLISNEQNKAGGIDQIEEIQLNKEIQNREQDDQKIDELQKQDDAEQEVNNENQNQVDDMREEQKAQVSEKSKDAQEEQQNEQPGPFEFAQLVTDYQGYKQITNENNYEVEEVKVDQTNQEQPSHVIQESNFQNEEEVKVDQVNEEEPPHVLQESKSLINLKSVITENQQKGQGKKGLKKKKQEKPKKILSPDELNDFLKKHKLISSNSLSDTSNSDIQIKPKNQKPQKITPKVLNKTSKPEKQFKSVNLPVEKIQPKQQIYRMCRDPLVIRSHDKIPQRRKFFSVLDLDLNKYKIGYIFSFLSDQDILNLRAVCKQFQPYLIQYFQIDKKVSIEKKIFNKRVESFDMKDRLYKNQYYKEKIEALTNQIAQNISHVHLYLYFDKLNLKSLKVNEVKLIKIFYEVLKTKPSIINSMQILNYCANRKDDKILFGDLNLSYDFMNELLQEKFYEELQEIIDFIKINNNSIIPFILENQIFLLKPDLIQKIEKNIFIDKTYSSKILKGIYHWLELQLFYNQYFTKDSSFSELHKNQEQINFIKHSYDIISYLLQKEL